ncbi:hypothetical protein B7494_g512 [Chlorociboria aeruginascens]|nr:hypothetical protein B7494_g512 [Chlorociboria aeruginascens]
MRAAIVGGVLRNSNSSTFDIQQQQQPPPPPPQQQLHHHPPRKKNTTTPAPTPTPTRPSRPRPPFRTPLQSRDHNAMMRVPHKGSVPFSLTGGNVNMSSYEKHNATRPLMPTLGASTKTGNRAPLTPRVAGSAPPPVSTPLSRRGGRSENNHSTEDSFREDLNTPVSAFLNNNITPRSGSRKSRVDSANTTPSGTPTGTPAPPPAPSAAELGRFQEPLSSGSGLGISGVEKDVPKRPVVSFSPPILEAGPTRGQAQSTDDSKFFFACDVKSGPPPSKSSRPNFGPNKSSTFLYANGEAIPQPSQSSGGSAVGSSIGEERSQPKFFHANGIPDIQATPSPHVFPPRPSSTISSSSRMTSPRLATASTNITASPLRPISPQKLHHQPLTLRNTPQIPSAPPRPLSNGRGQSANSIVSARRASVEASQRVVSHSRSVSLGSPDSLTPPSRKVSGGSREEPSIPFTPSNIVAHSAMVSTPEDISEENEPVSDPIPSGRQSPIKTGHSIEQMNELAANARRERKVLDLEITNSSLAAINRTLEREMRKQTAELRRYRRLSRSGRLSIATTTSMRNSSANLSIMDGVEGSQLSDMSEEEEEDEEDDEDFYSSESESLDGSLSPGAIEASDLRHRQKDEKRLQLDLAKHQQLLIDSQKMNQSLKRCLGWTEELISEGKKALEYRVRVSDVELGGRVLAPDEAEDVDNEGMFELGTSILKEAKRAAAEGISWATRKDDRDSGIDIDHAQQTEGEHYLPLSH